MEIAHSALKDHYNVTDDVIDAYKHMDPKCVGDEYTVHWVISPYLALITHEEDDRVTKKNVLSMSRTFVPHRSSFEAFAKAYHTRKNRGLLFCAFKLLMLSRRARQRMYAPGGNGFVSSKKRFKARLEPLPDVDNTKNNFIKFAYDPACDEIK